MVNQSRLHNESIQTTSEISPNISTSSPREIDCSVSPNKGSQNAIEHETIEDYLRFPDPLKYMVGFIAGIHESHTQPYHQSMIQQAMPNKRIKDGASNKQIMSDMAEESMTTKDSRGYGKSVASSAF